MNKIVVKILLSFSLVITSKLMLGQYVEYTFQLEPKLNFEDLFAKIKDPTGQGTNRALERMERKVSQLGMIGSIKSITDSSFLLVEKFGELEKGSIQYIITYNYDSVGNNIEYYALGECNGKSRYDINGNLVEKTFGKNEKVYTKWLYKKELKGNTIEEENFDGTGKRTSTGIILYNSKGLKIEENYFKIDGSIEGKIKYTYDEKNNNIGVKLYNGDGSLWSSVKYVYDENNNLIEYNKYHKNDEIPKEKFAFTYDSNKNILTIQREKGNNNSSEFIYNNKNLLIESNSKIFRHGLDIIQKVIYEYDSLNRTSKTVEYLPDGTINEQSTFSFTYDNDKMGNWIKISIYNSSGKSVSTIERKIAYYGF